MLRAMLPNDAASDAAERLLRAILLNDAAERCC